MKITHLEPTPFLKQTPEGMRQLARITVENPGPPTEARVTWDKEVGSLPSVPTGPSVHEFLIPEISSEWFVQGSSSQDANSYFEYLIPSTGVYHLYARVLDYDNAYSATISHLFSISDDWHPQQEVFSGKTDYPPVLATVNSLPCVAYDINASYDDKLRAYYRQATDVTGQNWDSARTVFFGEYYGMGCIIC